MVEAGIHLIEASSGLLDASLDLVEGSSNRSKLYRRNAEFRRIQLSTWPAIARRGRNLSGWLALSSQTPPFGGIAAHTGELRTYLGLSVKAFDGRPSPHHSGDVRPHLHAHMSECFVAASAAFPPEEFATVSRANIRMVQMGPRASKEGRTHATVGLPMHRPANFGPNLGETGVEVCPLSANFGRIRPNPFDTLPRPGRSRPKARQNVVGLGRGWSDLGHIMSTDLGSIRPVLAKSRSDSARTRTKFGKFGPIRPT